MAFPRIRDFGKQLIPAFSGPDVLHTDSRQSTNNVNTFLSSNQINTVLTVVEGRIFGLCEFIWNLKSGRGFEKRGNHSIGLSDTVKVIGKWKDAEKG